MTVAGRTRPPAASRPRRRAPQRRVCLVAIRTNRVSAVHYLSDGGLAVALAEMAIAGGIGATIAAEEPEHAFLFGEDQGRYIVTVLSGRDAPAIAEDAKQARRAAVAPRRHRRLYAEARLVDCRRRGAEGGL